MFFFFSVLPKQKQLSHIQSGTCPCCGRFGAFEVWLEYSCLAIFFLPLLKFGKHYMVRMSCCDAVYRLDETVGKAIERGDGAEILPRHLQLMRHGTLRCPNCGRVLTEQTAFCPHCGAKR